MNWKEELLRAREQWYLKKYQGARDFGVPVPKRYRDDSSNDLLRSVYDWLKFNNCYVNRVNVQGQVRIEKVPLANGLVRELVSWTRGTTNKGSSDLISLINNRFVAIEIKCKTTRDRIRSDQLKEKKRVEASGGIYLIVTDMSMFLEWYKLFLVNNKNHQNYGIA